MVISILLIVANIFFIFNYKEKEVISDDIINYLKDNKVERLYNSYDLGGYLIYKDIKPFIDGRADMYIDSIFKDVCYIEQGRDLELINKYDFDYYLVYKDSYVNKYLKDNNCEIIIENNVVLYKKK